MHSTETPGIISHSLVLVRAPLPQDALHSVHSVQSVKLPYFGLSALGNKKYVQRIAPALGNKKYVQRI